MSGKNTDHLRELQEDVEEIADRLSAGQRVRNVLFTIAAILVGFGQWNDSKELATQLYEAAISSFTHNVEYAALDEIAVGITRNYLEEVVGKPKVVKPSNIDNSVQYEYLFNDKYVLITLFRADRLVGYGVIALVDDFSPTIPFSAKSDELTGKQLNSLTLSQLALPLAESYSADYKNITFYVEHHTLDITGLFLHRSVGYVDYLSVAQPTMTDQIAQLLDAQMFEEEDAELLAQMRSIATPNFYAIGDVDPQLFIDALLTKYEYHKFK